MIDVKVGDTVIVLVDRREPREATVTEVAALAVIDRFGDLPKEHR